MFRFAPKYLFATYKFGQSVLDRLSTILKVQPYQINENVKFFGDVRLLDEHNKLIGVYACEEAKKKALKKEKDFVMLNQEVRPALCKMCDYSDELAQKFIEDVVKLKSPKSRESNVKLGHNITNQDLKIKVNQVQEIMKKQNNLRVYIICPMAQALQSKNVLYTFRDLTQQILIPLGDVQSKEYIPKDDFRKPKDEEEVKQVQLELEFESMDKKNIKNEITQIKLERMINQIYTRMQTSQKLSTQETIEEIKRINPQAYQDEEDIPEGLFTNEQVFERTTKKSVMKTTTLDDGEDEEQFEKQISKSEEHFIRDKDLSKYSRFFQLIEKAEKLK